MSVPGAMSMGSKLGTGEMDKREFISAAKDRRRLRTPQAQEGKMTI
jgi:hypothetical protein